MAVSIASRLCTGSLVRKTAGGPVPSPVSQFVAQFVGRVNLVSGRVAEIAGDRVKVAALGTALDARSTSKSSRRALRYNSSSVLKPSKS